jgi:hypothetical protein
MLKRMVGLGLAGALALTVMGTATAASASDAVERRGSCTSSSDWKIKAKPDDGRVQVEYEVESNRGRQTWHVRLFQNGMKFFSGDRTTGAASHSFTVRVFRPNTVGTDAFTARATNASTGEVCGGRVAL